MVLKEQASVCPMKPPDSGSKSFMLVESFAIYTRVSDEQSFVYLQRVFLK